MNFNQIINGDCLEILKTFPEEVFDSVVSDPPYGEGLNYAGDESLATAEQLLYSYLKAVWPRLKRSGHVVLFWTTRNLDVLIDAVRACGYTYRRTLSMYIPNGNARPYMGWLMRTQPVVVAQKSLTGSSEFHGKLAGYLNAAMARSGHTKATLAKALGCNNRLVMKWTRADDPARCLPTPRFYRPIKELLGLDDTFDILLDRQPGEVRPHQGVEYGHDCYVVTEPKKDTLHPSEKPLSVVRHIVQSVTPPGGLVFDGFAGSGTVAVASAITGRKFVCCELNPDFCAVARKRLGGQELNSPPRIGGGEGLK